MNLERYGSLLFDCDGVVINSNKVKTRAFYEAALPYGGGPAQAMVDYHVANGGISRYRKFAYFLSQLVPQGADGPGLDELLEAYANKVGDGLMACEVDSALLTLRKQTLLTPWFIVSGGDQAELREVFASRGLARLFDGGIFGSPDSKDEIFSRELQLGQITEPALFIGDSRYDHEASVTAGLDFVFVKHWTEFYDWKSYCESREIAVFDSLRDLT
jgi:phosphoglycolate phosphatase-like HAD superfamily hydrolase